MAPFLFVAGIIVAAACSLWLTLLMFSESLLLGLCSLAFPPVTLFYVATRWNEAKGVCLGYVSGLAMIGLGFAMSAG